MLWLLFVFAEGSCHSSAVISERVYHKTRSSERKKVLVITFLLYFTYCLPNPTQEKLLTGDQARLFAAPFTIPLICSAQAVLAQYLSGTAATDSSLKHFL